MPAPRSASDGETLSLAELILVDKLCDRFEAGRRAGAAVEIGDLLTGAPERTRPVLFRELLLVDMDYRSPEHPGALRAEYLSRFPEFAHVIDLVLGPGTSPPAPPVAANGQETPTLPDGRLGHVGRYRLLELVGRGGMGAVYRAHDPALERVVAVKIPHPEVIGGYGTKLRERFLREARHAARVRHAHVCPIHDAGEEEGIPYVVMDFIEGHSLAQELAARERFDTAEALRVVAELLGALSAVHGHNITHRDVKPANVLLDRSGRVVLTDFGLARPDAVTIEAGLAGTPEYMAPEQATAYPEGIDRRTDLYAVGVVLYQLVTGRVPFSGPPLAVVQAIRSEPFPRPSRDRPDLPSGLEAIILKATARRPEDRYQTAEEFSRALADWRAGGARPRNLRRPILIGVALIGLAVVAGLLLLPPGGSPEQTGLQTTEPRPAADPEREVAEWVLSVGGHVVLIDTAGRELRQRAAGDRLPDEPFHVYNVNLTAHAKFVPEDLDRLRNLKRLEYLSLSGLPVTDESLPKLAVHTALGGLYLDRTRVTDSGLEYLQSLPRLFAVTVRGAAVTAEGVARFRTARPDCQLGVE